MSVLSPNETSNVSGSWVADRLGVHVDDTVSESGLTVSDLVGLAVRKNPLRAHLLVSKVLGKHVPTSPDLVYGAGRLLGLLVSQTLTSNTSVPPGDVAGGALVKAALAGDPHAAQLLVAHADVVRRSARAVPQGTVVLGYAETATGLAQAVADSLDVTALSSTRREVDGYQSVLNFEEEHSHATTHLLLPTNQDQLAGPAPLVLVDDEVSTGQTLINTIRAVHRQWPRERYVVATLVDVRPHAETDRLQELALFLGVAIDVVSLAAGEVTIPDNIFTRAASLIADIETVALLTPRPVLKVLPAPPVRVDIGWPAKLPADSRHGFTREHRRHLEEQLPRMAALLVAQVPSGPVHVLGTEELMHVPVRLASALAIALPELEVTFSSTTRSPVLDVDDAGYAVRSRLTFPATDVAHGEARFAYNLLNADASPKFGTLVLVVDASADTDALYAPEGLASQLGQTASTLLVVRIGPDLAAPPAAAYLASTSTPLTQPTNSAKEL